MLVDMKKDSEVGWDCLVESLSKAMMLLLVVCTRFAIRTNLSESILTRRKRLLPVIRVLNLVPNGDLVSMVRRGTLGQPPVTLLVDNGATTFALT